VGLDRPTLAQIQSLQLQRGALEDFVERLQSAEAEERERLLRSVYRAQDRLRLPWQRDRDAVGRLQSQVAEHDADQQTEDCAVSRPRAARDIPPDSLEASSDDDFDVGTLIAFNETGTLSSFGPSSALHHPPSGIVASTPTHATAAVCDSSNISYTLIAKAALARQQERSIAAVPSILGVPSNLAMHLLDLHWSRQHHTFLLTYRPAIMRDLLNDGPYCSKFLLYAIFACASKFSGRTEVRDDPADSNTAGQRFFRQCDDLIAQDSLLLRPKLPTVAALLLLGSTYNARGQTSKAWLYTGYALRMVYDLGMHLEPTATGISAEEAEVRRRVFGGAFVCDKLQSLYLWRPASINLCDFHVSRDFADTYEEEELYLPYIDPEYPDLGSSNAITRPGPIYSVSTFQQLCLLSKIMTKIINVFYKVKATPRNAEANLKTIDRALQHWQENLPTKLQYEPQQGISGAQRCPAPNQLCLHGVFYSLIILLHRPFTSDRMMHTIPTPAHSWVRCGSAAKSITSIALAWKSACGLLGAPYLLSYAIYVACTIHVRNAVAEIDNRQSREHSSMLAASLSCLEEQCQANPGVKRPIEIIRASMLARRIVLSQGKFDDRVVLSRRPRFRG
jgi:hypothetical protein